MTGPLKNEQDQFSGAKLVLLIACGLTVAWLARDLATGEKLTEWHTAFWACCCWSAWSTA